MSSNNLTKTLLSNMMKVIETPRAMAAKAHAGPSILDLTPEIRNMIMAYLFEYKEKIRLNYSEDQEVVLSKKDKPALRPPIPVKTDAYLSILYSNNIFVFGKKPEDHLENLGMLDLCAN
jgi:hypothetical protein